MTKKCPKCKLVNPPEAELCDCGYNFLTKGIQQPLDSNFVDRKRTGYKLCLVGFIIFTLINIFKFLAGLGNSNPDGNTSTIVYGLDIFVGLAAIIVFISLLSRSKLNR